jgi:hypothetical protein
MTTSTILPTNRELAINWWSKKSYDEKIEIMKRLNLDIKIFDVNNLVEADKEWLWKKEQK